MKIIFTSDLHYGCSKDSDLIPMVNQIAAEKPDMLCILGDVAEGVIAFDKCLSLFKNIDCEKYVIPGNHDLYEYQNTCSKDLYNSTLPQIAKFHNFSFGNQLIVKDNLSIILTSAWTNGTFNSNNFAQLAIDQSYYTYMSDGKYISIPYKELHKKQLSWFKRTLKKVTTPRLIIGTHYPIFSQLYEPYRGFSPSDAFFYSEQFGEHLLAHSERFELVSSVSGHVHRHADVEINNVKCFIIASDYKKPKYVSIEIND